MERINLDYCKYIQASGIHKVDYSGVINLDEGLSRIENLEKYFNINKKPGEAIKVLMDARKYIKHSPETHDKLAKLSRKIFHEKFEIFLAVLNPEHSNVLSDKEAWFTSVKDAHNWLRDK
jgi:hypothetical protein